MIRKDQFVTSHLVVIGRAIITLYNVRMEYRNMILDSVHFLNLLDFKF